MTPARFVVTFAAASIALGACGGHSPDDLTVRLQTDGTLLDLAEAIPGPWERAYVFGEYDTASTIQAALCHEWTDAEVASGYTRTDGYYVVVFTKDPGVLSWATVNVDTGSAPPVAFDWPASFYVDHSTATFITSAGLGGSSTLRPTQPRVPACD